MMIARTVGTVTLSRCHPALNASTLRCVEQVTSINDIAQQPLGGETIVAWDLVGSGIGDLVAVAEGPEAAQPFAPEIKPLDASIVAILDHVQLESKK
jgi:microcompartment protein CcmK/EutM